MTDATGCSASLSLVLVTHNGWQHTAACLAQVFAQSFAAPLEVIVVDNASSDGTPENIRNAFPQVKLIESAANLGFGAACNLGLEDAAGDFYVLLNNDALVDAGQLEALVQAYQRHGLNGIYTARIVDADGAEEASCFRQITPADLLIDTFMLMSTALARHSYALAERDEEALDIAACSGAFCLFPRELWQQTGGFDERFFMYYEDMDLCQRARTLGYGVYVNTRITLLHKGGGSAPGNVWRARIVDASQRLFYHKHYGSWGLFAARLHQVLRSTVRAIIHGLFALNARHRALSSMHARLALDALVGARP